MAGLLVLSQGVLVQGLAALPLGKGPTRRGNTPVLVRLPVSFLMTMPERGYRGRRAGVRNQRAVVACLAVKGAWSLLGVPGMERWKEEEISRVITMTMTMMTMTMRMVVQLLAEE